MKNYWAHTPGIFETNEKEILKLKKAWVYTKEKYNDNLKLIQNYFKRRNGLDIIDFTICEVPEKKDKYDNAVILCFMTKDFKYYAKRYHNTQWLKLEY